MVFPVDLTSVFSRFEDLNVLVIGDIMLDRYIYGRVSRISPEAPVPVVEWDDKKERPGGAANVAINVRSLGAKASMCAITGKDEEGTVLSDLLSREEIDLTCVIASSLRPTTLKTRVIAGNQHLLRLDRESTVYLGAEETGELLVRIGELFQRVSIDMIILQDYNKGVLSEELISGILQLAALKSIPVAVDPKYRNFWCYRGVQLIKPNLKEVRDVLPFRVDIELGSLKRASQAIRKRLGNALCMITLSEKGVFMDDGTEAFILPAQPRNVADVCGAGDGVVSVAALGMAAGLHAWQIALLANLAGGQIVEKVGVVPVDRDLLLEHVKKEKQVRL